MVEEVSNEANWSADSTLDLSQVEDALEQKLADAEASQTAETPTEPSSGSKFTSFVADQAVGVGIGLGVAKGMAIAGAGPAAPIVGGVITLASVAKGVSSFTGTADGKKKRTTRPSAMTSTPSKATMQMQRRMNAGSIPKSSIFVNGAKLRTAGKKGDLFSKIAIASATTAHSGAIKVKSAKKPASYHEIRNIKLRLGRIRRMQEMGPMVIAGEDTMGPRAQQALKDKRNDDVVRDRVMDYSNAMNQPQAPTPPTTGAAA